MIDKKEFHALVGKEVILTDHTGEIYEGSVVAYNLEYLTPYVVVKWSDGLEVNYSSNHISMDGDKVRVAPSYTQSSSDPQLHMEEKRRQLREKFAQRDL